MKSTQKQQEVKKGINWTRTLVIILIAIFGLLIVIFIISYGSSTGCLNKSAKQLCKDKGMTFKGLGPTKDIIIIDNFSCIDKNRVVHTFDFYNSETQRCWNG